MKEQRPYTWLQPDGKGGKVRINMYQMDDKTLQEKFMFASIKEFEHYTHAATYSELMRELLQVAEERGLRLLFPDEKPPETKRLYFGNYFKNSRKVLDIEELETVRQEG